MYPKDKKTAAMMSEAIREILSDQDMMNAIMENSSKKPVYWDMLPKKDGITAIVVAQMLKAMAGDTSAFTALSRFGFGEKVQMEVSDFYRTNRIDINVINPEPLEGEEIDTEKIGAEAHDTVAKMLDGGEDGQDAEALTNEEGAKGMAEGSSSDESGD